MVIASGTDMKKSLSVASSPEVITPNCRVKDKAASTSRVASGAIPRSSAWYPRSRASSLVKVRVKSSWKATWLSVEISTAESTVRL
jgi:hypothetical protein